MPGKAASDYEMCSELRLIKSDIERAAGEPARLVRLVLVGPQDCLTMRDREIIEEAQREIDAARSVAVLWPNRTVPA